MRRWDGEVAGFGKWVCGVGVLGYFVLGDTGGRGRGENGESIPLESARTKLEGCVILVSSALLRSIKKYPMTNGKENVSRGSEMWRSWVCGVGMVGKRSARGLNWE
ncbi:hypothetical protein BDV93DRAFT_253133 [Ceratobasidium sp. AG-I]|nr:hypothetical protein BDV93DRAFT_253133 [Ceratobasidium sp. AG-I]